MLMIQAQAMFCGKLHKPRSLPSLRRLPGHGWSPGMAMDSDGMHPDKGGGVVNHVEKSMEFPGSLNRC